MTPYLDNKLVHIYTTITEQDTLHSFIHSFIHPAVCLTTGPKPLPKPVLIQCDLMLRLSIDSILFSLRPPRSCQHLLPCLPVTFIPPSIFPSTTCFRRQFLWMSPIHLDFLIFILIGRLSSLTPCKHKMRLNIYIAAKETRQPTKTKYANVCLVITEL